MHKLQNVFQPVQPPHTLPQAPPTTPPHHMQTPESGANLAITTAPPAVMLIHYDGFILAIFSICPLAFFFTTLTDGGYFFRIFFLSPIFACGRSGLAEGAEPIAKKKKGRNLFAFQGYSEFPFFLPWRQSGCSNPISTQALTLKDTHKHTHTCAESVIGSFAVRIQPDEAGPNLADARWKPAVPLCCTSRWRSGRVAVPLRVRPRPRPVRFRVAAPCGALHRRSSRRIQAVPAHHLPQPLSLFIYILFKNTDRFCHRTHWEGKAVSSYPLAEMSCFF